MPKRKNIVGNVYDELTVTEMLYNYNNKHRTYCKCIGIDGKEYIIRQDALQSGVTHTIKGAMKKQNEDISNQRFGNLVALYPTLNRASNGNIIWYCGCDCGNYTYVPSGNLKRKHTLSCGCRKNSKWEIYIKEYLETNKIDYISQKYFKDCKNKNNTCYLFFDFYLPQYNTIIEYDGLQHFESVKHWGGEEKFKVVQENDKIKDDYCQNNNINMIRIPYTLKEKEIIQILNDIIYP